MKWTENLPTVEGWYWRVQSWEGKRITAGAAISLCHVALVHGSMLLYDEDDLLYGDGDTRRSPLTYSTVTFLWWGPIAQPEPPEVAS